MYLSPVLLPPPSSLPPSTYLSPGPLPFHAGKRRRVRRKKLQPRKDVHTINMVSLASLQCRLRALEAHKHPLELLLVHT